MKSIKLNWKTEMAGDLLLKRREVIMLVLETLQCSKLVFPGRKLLVGPLSMRVMFPIRIVRRGCAILGIPCHLVEYIEELGRNI